MWPYSLLLCFCSTQNLSTLLVLICTNNFSVEFYKQSPTDEHLLAVFWGLWGDDSGINETESDDDNYELMWVLDVKIVAHELSGPFVNVWAPKTDNDSSYPPENIHKKFFMDNFLLTYTIPLSQLI